MFRRTTRNRNEKKSSGGKKKISFANRSITAPCAEGGSLWEPQKGEEMGEIFAFLMGVMFGVILGFVFSTLAIVEEDRDNAGEEDKNWWE